MDPEQIEAKKEEENQEELQKQLEERSNILRQYGFEETYVPGLAQSYENIYSYENLPENLQYLSEPLRQTNAYLFSDKSGRMEIIRPELPENEWKYYFETPGSKEYGRVISKDARIYNPEDVNYNEFAGDYFSDPTKGKDLRGIEGTINGQNMNIEGVPIYKNGEVSFIDRLLISDPNNPDEYRELENLGGSLYKDINTGETLKVNLNKFKEYSQKSPISYFTISSIIDKDEFAEIPETNTNKSVEQIKTDVNNVDIGNKTDHIYAKAVSELKYIIKNSPSYLERIKATEEYERIKQLYNSNNSSKFLVEKFRDNVNNKPSESSNINFNRSDVQRKVNRVNYTLGLKKGGVIKYEFGGKYRLGMSPDEYLEKYKTYADTAVEKGPRNIRGTLKDMSDLDKASLVSSALSVVPVLGVAGGLATTAFDIASDIKTKGKVDLANLGLNLGFTALSLVGAGGIGAAARLGKAAAKTGKVTKTVLKGIDTAEEATKLAKAANKITKIEKGSYKAAGITADEFNLLKKAKVVGEKSNLGTIVNKNVIKTANETVNTLKRMKGSPIESEFSGLIKAGKNIVSGTKKVGKAAPYIVGVPMALGVGQSVVNAVKDVSEGGFSNIQHQDLKNLLLATGGARGFIKNRQLKNMARNLKTTAKDAKPFYEINGKKFEIKEGSGVSVPKSKKSYIINKKSSTKDNDENLEKFKEKFKQITGEDLPKDVSLKDIMLKEPTKDQIKGLSESGLKIKDYNRALAKLKGKNISYGLPS
jgi:hypothetical protein